MEKNRHPYEIRQTIKGRNWHLAFKLQDGSLYYAVDQLRDEGLIEVSEVIAIAGDKRPDKTVYRITDQGQAALLEQLYKQMEKQYFPQHPLFKALPFAWHADNAQMEELIERQLANCELRQHQMKLVLDNKGDRLPRGAVRLIQGILKFIETEREWLLDLLKDARSGLLSDPGNKSLPESR